MRFSTPSTTTLVALLASIPLTTAGNVCLARACDIGLPTGTGPACGMQMWRPGREPCGAQSAEIPGGGTTDTMASPWSTILCNQRVTIVHRPEAPGGAVLSFLGIEYEGIDLAENPNGDPYNQNCDEGCGLSNNFGRILWPEVPVCN